MCALTMRSTSSSIRLLMSTIGPVRSLQPLGLAPAGPICVPPSWIRTPIASTPRRVSSGTYLLTASASSMNVDVGHAVRRDDRRRRLGDDADERDLLAAGDVEDLVRRQHRLAGALGDDVRGKVREVGTVEGMLALAEAPVGADDEGLTVQRLRAGDDVVGVRAIGRGRDAAQLVGAAVELVVADR